jgi:hypothetical protein
VTLVQAQELRLRQGRCRVPPEEFGISKNARTIKDATYCFHEPQQDRIRPDRAGLRRGQVKSLPTAQRRKSPRTSPAIRCTRTDRNRHDEQGVAADRRSSSITSDGLRGRRQALLYRVTTGGKQLEVLKRDGKPDVVPVDVMPFAAMTPSSSRIGSSAGPLPIS